MNYGTLLFRCSLFALYAVMTTSGIAQVTDNPIPSTRISLERIITKEDAGLTDDPLFEEKNRQLLEQVNEWRTKAEASRSRAIVSSKEDLELVVEAHQKSIGRLNLLEDFVNEMPAARRRALVENELRVTKPNSFTASARHALSSQLLEDTTLADLHPEISFDQALCTFILAGDLEKVKSTFREHEGRFKSKSQGASFAKALELPETDAEFQALHELIQLTDDARLRFPHLWCVRAIESTYLKHGVEYFTPSSGENLDRLNKLLYMLFNLNKRSEIAMIEEKILPNLKDYQGFAESSYWVAMSFYANDELDAAADRFLKVIERPDNSKYAGYSVLKYSAIQLRTEKYEEAAIYSLLAVDLWPDFLEIKNVAQNQLDFLVTMKLIEMEKAVAKYKETQHNRLALAK
jgi:TolA-binding protein